MPSPSESYIQNRFRKGQANSRNYAIYKKRYRNGESTKNRIQVLRSTMIQVTIQFPSNDYTGEPIKDKDVRQWALNAMKATEGFTGIRLKLVEIKKIQDDDN